MPEEWFGFVGFWCVTPILAILWQSVLLVEETGVPGENYRAVVSYWQTLFLREENLSFNNNYIIKEL